MRLKPTIVKSGACALLGTLLSGCLPYPHTTDRSWEIEATVLDARTHAPIKGAKVVQSEFGDGRPGKTRRRTTDGRGHFKLSATHNFHLAIGAVGEGGDWPSARYYDNVIVTCTNYLVYEIRGMHQLKGVIHLQPVYPLEVSGRLLDERTKAPVEGATVGFSDGPKLECVSDAAGRFRLKANTEFYRAMASQGPLSDLMYVSHPRYWVRSFHCGDDGDILLHPYE